MFVLVLLAGGSCSLLLGRRDRAPVLGCRCGSVVGLESVGFLSGFGGPEWRIGIAV